MDQAWEEKSAPNGSRHDTISFREKSLGSLSRVFFIKRDIGRDAGQELTTPYIPELRDGLEMWCTGRLGLAEQGQGSLYPEVRDHLQMLYSSLLCPG